MMTPKDLLDYIKSNELQLIFDSRSLVSPANTLFCAIRTKAADGHSYINEMYRSGVRNFLVEKIPDSMSGYPDANFIVVENVAESLEKIAMEWRKIIKATVVGITGSAGKTIVKELIYRYFIEQGVEMSRSPRSWNSRLGVPLSLLEISPEDKIGLIEVGIDSPGDMVRHAEIVMPEIGALTSITTEHDAGFKNREEKIREKLLLFRHSKTIIYDGSERMVDKIIKETYPDKNLIAVNVDDPSKINAAIAERVIEEFVKDKPGLTAETVTNRINVHEGINDCVMLYDDFTHDIRSVQWALDFMRRRSTADRGMTVIMSDLFHGPLPEKEIEALYCNLGKMLESFGIRRLIAIGNELKKYSEVIPPVISVENVDSVDEFLKEYDINRFSSETILITGQTSNEFRNIKALLESPRHDTILEVNLDAIVHNFNYFRSKLKPGTGLVAMIKASAYGAGAVEVAKTLQAQGASYLAVAVIDEGIELRKAGITMPIVVLNPVTTNYRALFRHNLEPSVFSLRELDILIEEARKAGMKDFKAHIKLDTGMHRVGFIEKELPALIERLNETEQLTVASVFSHLATADCPDEKEYTRMQLDSFARMSDYIVENLNYTVKRHILNTAGIISFPESQYDMVRLGIGLYGIGPMGKDGNLRPVSALKTTIISLKKWEAGTTIGYARRGRLDRDSVIATLPIGYADGIDRRLSRGNTSFIVRGVECPTVGNICMDQCMIDVTDVPDVRIGDEVEIFGQNIPVEKIAEILDTIPYEVLTSVSPRVRRIYYRD